MILTPITVADLPALLAAFDRGLDDSPLAQTVFRRIAASLSAVQGDLSQDNTQHRQAVALLERFGMGCLDACPTKGYTWDGEAVATRMEPSVLVHEVGHFQTCAPERRTVADFGLGPGPETGKHDNAVLMVGDLARDMEEALASLQGILWEVELGHPALLAFLEQNWLEGGAKASNTAHFVKIVNHLHSHGLVDDDARPTDVLRSCDDATFLGPLCTASKAQV